MSTVTGYSRAQIRLHWIVVALLVPQYLLHEGMAQTFEDGMRAGALTLSAPAIGHIAGGIAILLLVVWRLALRAKRGAPPPPETEPAWAKLAAKATHLAFYGVLILLPVSGGLAWAMESEALGEVHKVLRAVLLLLIVLHIGAVLVHQVVWKTGLMDRMRRPAG